MKERENYQNMVRRYGGVFIVTDPQHFRQMIKFKVLSLVVLICLVFVFLGLLI